MTVTQILEMYQLKLSQVQLNNVTKECLTQIIRDILIVQQSTSKALTWYLIWVA
jgi:hypothetical protein